MRLGSGPDLEPVEEGLRVQPGLRGVCATVLDPKKLDYRCFVIVTPGRSLKRAYELTTAR